jgi:para-aminobenzoate synthetase component 1
MLKRELNYQHDSAPLFARIAAQPWAMFLDSGQAINPATGKPGSQYGRYDILVAEPFITLVTQGNITAVTQNGQVKTSEEDPFLLLKNLLNLYKAPKTGVLFSGDTLPFAGGASPVAGATLPFAGGALGYFAYDLGRRIEKLPNNAIPAIETPEMMVAIYDWALVVDHRAQRSYLVSHGFDAKTHEKWHGLQALFDAPSGASFTKNNFEVKSPVSSNLPEAQYKQAFEKIKTYITEGDCYQVNLAQRFSAEVAGDSWTMYEKLREINPAPFMAYMNLPLNETECFQVLSDSPERFLQTTGKHVETRPIKGTRPRSSNPEQDIAYSKELLTSVKDKAENLMIVDLLRNDLSKTCETGSVKVSQLFQLQSFANVHHLVSIIVGKLKPHKTSVDVLRACFPGGSITGAPKLRAMEIIDELEPHRRGLYCGAIGYISFDGDMDTNIAIRTAVICKNTLSFYAGGGIVADSDAQKEYLETLDKASSFTTITKFFTKL